MIRYFGKAAELPGVKELFEAEPQEPVKKTRRELHRLVDVDYYGFRDEDDGALLEYEATFEPAFVSNSVELTATVVPDNQAIEARLIEIRKEQLLAKYAMGK